MKPYFFFVLFFFFAQSSQKQNNPDEKDIVHDSSNQMSELAQNNCGLTEKSVVVLNSDIPFEDEAEDAKEDESRFFSSPFIVTF